MDTSVYGGSERFFDIQRLPLTWMLFDDTLPAALAVGLLTFALSR
jgi:hypothetical protein